MPKDTSRESKMLREARLQKGYSQQYVATLIGVHIKQYQHLEYGKRRGQQFFLLFGLDIEQETTEPLDKVDQAVG